MFWQSLIMAPLTPFIYSTVTAELCCLFYLARSPITMFRGLKDFYYHFTSGDFFGFKF